MVLDIAPQADYEIVDCASVSVFAQAPYIFQDRFARHGAAVLPYQMTQELGFHQRKLNGVVWCAELEIIKVYSPAVEGKDSLLRRSYDILSRRGRFLISRFFL